MRATARLAGVSPSALLDKRANHPGLLTRLSGDKDLPEYLQPFAGMNFEVIDKLPEVLITAVFFLFKCDSRSHLIKKED